MNLKIKAITLIGIILITFLIYGNSMHAPFAFDDPETIINNKDLKTNSIYSQFNKPRYIGYITFALNYHFNKSQPYGYHIVNVSIHSLNGILAFLLISYLLNITKPNFFKSNNYLISLITALLFVMHPIQTQAVTYISQRFASLATFFIFLSIYFYILYRKENKNLAIFFYILSLIFALSAYKTKENTASLPLILLVLEWLVFKSSTSIKKIFAIIPYFLLISVIIISFLHTSKTSGSIIQDVISKSVETTNITRSIYLMTQFRVITTYIRLLLIPINQSVDYLYPLSQSFFEFKTFISFLFLLSLLIIAVIIRKKHVTISVGILWFFIFLSIE